MTLAEGAVLVTGARGFVGAHVLDQLRAAELDVHAVVRRAGPATAGVRWYEVDLDDGPAVSSLVGAVRPRTILHLAGPSTRGGQVVRPVTEGGDDALVEASIRFEVACLVRAGDAFECASSGEPLAEDAPGATDPWGRARRRATDRAHAAADGTRCRLVTLRLFSVYGPSDHPHRLVPALIVAARTGRPVALTTPAVVRDWSHVDDVAAAFLRAASDARVEGVVHLGTGVSTTLGSLVQQVEATAGRPIDARWGEHPASSHDAGFWVADPTLARRAIGWSPRPLATGLAEVIGG